MFDELTCAAQGVLWSAMVFPVLYCLEPRLTDEAQETNRRKTGSSWSFLTAFMHSRPVINEKARSPPKNRTFFLLIKAE